MTPSPRPAAESEELVAATGLLAGARPLLVMLSGGQDSTCLLDLAVRLKPAGTVRALHVDHGLRSRGADEGLCRRLCARLGVELAVERLAGPPEGNRQGWARDGRYAAARAMAARDDAELAAGHTADDQVETVLYRLAASPGRRALLGMRARESGLLRPLLALRRADTAAYCAERGLEFADDPTNADLVHARNRVRHELLPAWRTLHPAADENLLSTLERLREEAEALDAVVVQALERAGSPPRLEALRALPPAIARLALQAIADAACGGRAPALGARAQDLLELGRRGGSAHLDLPGGLRAEAVYGELTIAAGGTDTAGAATGPAATAPPAPLPVPGAVAFAGGRLSAERGRFPVADGVLDAEALGPRLEVRGWRAGDRMRPLGLGGSKRLQDLFTDAKVPRARRARLPVVVARGEVAWIPGVATGEGFKARAAGADHVRLSWAPPEYD